MASRPVPILPSVRGRDHSGFNYSSSHGDRQKWADLRDTEKVESKGHGD